MLNPVLDIPRLKNLYQQNQSLLIPNVLIPEIAQQIYQAVLNLDWYLEINDYNPGKRLRIPLAEVRNPKAPLLNVLDEIDHHLDVNKLFYMRLNVDGTDFHEPMLKELSAFLNTEAFLTPMREITGQADVNHCWVEATCYQSCCFLGGHRDDHHANNRVAFVLNLTPHWELDWGGLLMLVNSGGQTNIVPPLWNSLSLFTVPRDHLVTAVSPGARGNRYSLTGWLRDGSPA